MVPRLAPGCVTCCRLVDHPGSAHAAHAAWAGLWGACVTVTVQKLVRPRPRGHRQGYNFLTQLCAVKPEVPKPPLVPLQTAHKPHRLMLPRLRGHNMYQSGSYTAHTDRIASVSGAYTLIFPPSGPVTGNIGCLAELVVSRIRAHSRTIVAAAWVRVPGHRIWPR